MKMKTHFLTFRGLLSSLFVLGSHPAEHHEDPQRRGFSMQWHEGSLQATYNECLMEIYLVTEHAANSLDSQITQFCKLQSICKGRTKTTKAYYNRKDIFIGLRLFTAFNLDLESFSFTPVVNKIFHVENIFFSLALGSMTFRTFWLSSSDLAAFLPSLIPFQLKVTQFIFICKA